MESCILCLEINKNFVDSIKTNSAKWQENQIAELIEKHFWPLTYQSGRTTQIDTDKGIDYEDNKEGIPYGLLEPEILIDKPPETDESEILLYTAVKTEPQDESFTDVLNEPKSMPLKMNNNPSNKDDQLENPIEPKRISAKSKRKIERKNTNKTSCKVTKAEKLEIKMENCNDDSDENDNYEAIKKHDDDSSDSEDSSDNNNDQQADSDSPHSTERKKRKNYYKHRTNRKENDQFIAKHLKDIACDLCKTSFESFGALRHHFTEIHKRRGYVICCSKKFCNRTLLVDHIHTHLNPDHFKCTKCDRVLPDRLRLENHMLRLHEVTELEKKRCDVCQKPFIDGYSLRIHKLTHLPEDQKKFPCKECGKIYANSYLLKAPYRTDTFKEFCKVCYICGKSICTTSADYNYI
ncbi:hypothetical protein DOY81_011413 [Sarcophaga bullata]|nr:hypothetical protein DOY81_011413 [Sarcophaga bullata]